MGGYGTKNKFFTPIMFRRSALATGVFFVVLVCVLLFNPYCAEAETILSFPGGWITNGYVMTQEGSPYIINTSTLRMGSSATVTAEAGTVIKFWTGLDFPGQFIIYGRFIINGTEENPVVITSYNKGILEMMIEGYNNTEKIKITLNKLSTLLIREDSSMKVKDKLFINRLETYTNNGIKRVNRLQDGITQMQDALNNEITGGNPIVVSRLKDNIAEFSVASKFVLKLYNYYLDVIGNLIVENRILLRKNKNWKFHKTKMEKLYSKRSKEIEKEQESFNKNYLNPLIVEQKNNLKKYELWNEKRDE